MRDMDYMDYGQRVLFGSIPFLADIAEISRQRPDHPQMRIQKHCTCCSTGRETHEAFGICQLIR